MSKSKASTSANTKESADNDVHKAIKTSLQPFHFGMELVESMQNYNHKNMDFITKRVAEDIKIATSISMTTDPNVILKESSEWWYKMGQDYLNHLVDSLDFSREVRTEISELAETEAEILKAKPQDMFDNSPV